MENGKFQTLDIYLTAFLAYHGIQPNLEDVNGKIVFTFSGDQSKIFETIARFNANEMVPANTFATIVKSLRGRMLTLKGAGFNR